MLTIEGISFWSVISPMFALGYVARVLSKPAHKANLLDYCHTLVRKANRLAVDAAIPIVVNKKGCKGWPGKNTFLFLGFSHYMYRENLQPVAARIASRPGCSVIILDDVLPLSLRNIGDDGLMFQSLWQHWDESVSRTERRMRKALKEAIFQLKTSGLPEIVESTGMNWKDFQHAFAWLFYSCLPRSVSQAAIALHIIKQHRPLLLISPDVNDPRVRVFCLAGKLSGVRTLEIQFAYQGLYSIEWRFFIAAHLTIPGSKSQEVMISHGIPLEKMTITGSPCYDRSIYIPLEQVKPFRTDLGIAEDKLMLLFASQPYINGPFNNSEIRREMIKGLFQSVSHFDEIVLVVKPHPLENYKDLANMARGIKNIKFVEKSIDIRDLISVTDSFVTFFSSTAFHALILNKPTINLSFPGAYDNDVFENSGATLVARNLEDIERILKEIINSKITEIHKSLAHARENFLNRWFYSLDECASKRIESVALEMVPDLASNIIMLK